MAFFVPVLYLGIRIGQCQMVVFDAADLEFLGPGIADLMTELCPPQNTA